MASSSIDEEIIEITKRDGFWLQKYLLENVKEIYEDRDVSEKILYDKVLECDGNRYVGRMLHLKFFDFDKDPSKMLQKLFSEIQLLSKMKHSNIVSFIGIFYEHGATLPVLVMEKMEYSLNEYLSTHDRGSISEDIQLRILLNVATGLVYLHKELQVAHKDLSSNSILLAGDLSAKIADLGSARVLDRPGGWSPHAILKKQPEVLHFIPFEALENPSKYTVSADVFSFGCVIIHLITHIWPSPDPKNESRSEIERRWKYISEMKDSCMLPMVSSCLAESAKRPTSVDVMSTLKAKAKEIKPDYTIVFTGIAGSGKSTAGNKFFNKKVFSTEEGLVFGTAHCSAHVSTICGETVKIIDTPGFFDGFRSDDDNFRELARALILAKDGIHAVAFVMSNIRYTTQCKDAIQQIARFEGLQPYLFVLLTNAKNNGFTKVETDEYIQKTLSNKRCPPDFKDLMQLVDNRVIMLESGQYTPENIFAQKREEFIMMIKKMHKTNKYKVYTNPVLQRVAQVFEKTNLQQQIKIRTTEELLKLNKEKINQLKKANDDATAGVDNAEAPKIIDAEIASLMKENELLEETLKNLTDKQHLENFTNQIMTDDMKNSKITERNISDFFTKYTAGGYLLGMSIGNMFSSTLGNTTGIAGSYVGYRIAKVVYSCRNQ